MYESESDLDPQLNFISEFNLSRNGMIKEIKTEFDIIRLCLAETEKLPKENVKILDRILVMPLRKLLCETSSVLLAVEPNFKLSPLTGPIIELNNKLRITRSSLELQTIDKWIPVSTWLKTNIAYFDRDVCDLPRAIPEFDYHCIMNKLKKAEKLEFEQFFQKENVTYHGKPSVIYERILPEDTNSNAEIFDYLQNIGYNQLTIYTFLKHQSDKRGAHIDVGHSLLIEMSDNPITKHITITLCIAIQLIVAAKTQIPELANYWPEMPELICSQ